jgi:hypothetical protein
MTQKTKTLDETLKDLTQRGFSDDFKPHTETISAMKASHVYFPDQLKVIEKYQFEPEKAKEMPRGVMAVEGVNGIKGILLYNLDPKGTPQNPLVSQIPAAAKTQPKTAKKAPKVQAKKK